MRYAVIENDVVINAIEADADFSHPGMELVADPDGSIHIGYARVAGEFGPPQIPLVDLKKERLAALAARRWQAETGGIVFMGMSIKTDEDTQRKITGAYVQATRDSGFVVKWKVAPGVFIDLDAAAIIAIGDAVTAHIQACFANEAALTAAILAAGDVAALSAIDIESGWPG